MQRFAICLAVLVAGLGSTAFPATAQQECLPGPAAVAHTNGRIELAWPSVPGATAYQIVFRAGDEGDWTPIAPQVPASSTAYTFSPTTSGIVYDFVIVALSGPSEEINSFCQVSATGIGPPCPDNLTATRMEDGIHLEWDAVDGVDGYNVYRAIDDGPFLFKGHGTDTSALDNGNNDQGTDITNATRQYIVRSTLGEGQSGICPIATVTEIPFFPGPLAVGLALSGALVASVVLARPRRRT